MNFVLKNGDGSILVDFFSGLTIETDKQLYLFSVITPNSHFDKSTNLLELTYQLHSDSGNVPKLENATVEITGIKAVYQTNDDEPGEYQMTTEEIKGSWKLSIDTGKINTFEAVDFLPTDSKKAAGIRGTAYPSSFILLSEIPFTETNYFDDMRIVTVMDGVEESYPLTQTSLVEENGKEYTQFIFDYPRYDEAKILKVNYLDTATMEEVSIELEQR
ncbi:hypothetical protein LI951_05100 [Enterococcus sp. BWT-B8]|uniref:hypothetical protein n=1 Tax=Enterococcus sp. BWT-B8 TaxID=2885157 RepID=UPI001E3F929F|nr:hypothetical protein [Enterococcus sp. BWT-B8]MCB5951435.1 hypothetical protein [Enterococcus sp. BWT-B8]